MIIYLIKSTLLLALLFGLYKLLLENEKMHRFNRFFLLFALIFGLTAPLISFELSPDTKVAGIELSKVQSTVNAPAEAVSRTVEPLVNPVPMTTPNPNLAQTEHASPPMFTLRNVLLGIYGMITFVLLFRFFSGLYQIRTNIISGDTIKVDGAKLILLDHKISPQSFFRYIFLNKKDFNAGRIGKEIIEHELTHVRQLHSFDVLLIELLKVFFWFNPALFLYKHAIQLNHEFLADEFVVSTVSTIPEYQRTLLEVCNSEQPLNIASGINFNFATTKQRLEMMSKDRTPIKSFLKLLFLTPVFLVLPLVLGCDLTSEKHSLESASNSELQIKVLENNQLLVNGVEMALDEVNTHLSNLPEPLHSVKLTVSGKAHFGRVTDIQRILQQHDVFKIDYKTSQNDELIEKIK